MAVPASAGAACDSDSYCLDAVIAQGLYTGVNAATLGAPANSLNTQIKRACGYPANISKTAIGDYQDTINNGLMTGVNLATTGKASNPGSSGCSVRVSTNSSGTAARVTVRSNDPWKSVSYGTASAHSSTSHKHVSRKTYKSKGTVTVVSTPSATTVSQNTTPEATSLTSGSSYQVFMEPMTGEIYLLVPVQSSSGQDYYNTSTSTFP